MYISYCDTKGQTDIEQNYSSDVRDDAQYKTNSHFFLTTLFSECACDRRYMPTLQDSAAIAYNYQQLLGHS